MHEEKEMEIPEGLTIQQKFRKRSETSQRRTNTNFENITRTAKNFRPFSSKKYQSFAFLVWSFEYFWYLLTSTFRHIFHSFVFFYHLTWPSLMQQNIMLRKRAFFIHISDSVKQHISDSIFQGANTDGVLTDLDQNFS